MSTNYAKEVEYDNIPAAVIFTVAYIALLGWFIRQSIKIPTYVHWHLAFFCQLRIVAFVIRAVAAGSEKAGEKLGLIIADQVLFGVGFFGLLYSAYTLVLDRELLTDTPRQKKRILSLVSDRRLFRLALTIGVILGIVSAAKTESFTEKENTAEALHEGNLIIFLILTLLQAFMTVVLARDEKTRELYSSVRTHGSIGRKHGIWVLLVISVLLIIREVFSVATLGNERRANDERLWYPLVAVPEIVAMCLYATPGLVPRRDELRQREEKPDSEKGIKVAS